MPRSRSRFSVPLVFGLFFVFVCLAANVLHRSEFEMEMIKLTHRQLDRNGLGHISVTFQGSRGVLAGEVSTSAMKERAAYLVAEVQGVTAVDVDRVRVSKP